ncbi:MAG TPA: GNAT family N-acetyltransferase [Pedobacter sp.]|nr:GNAT family N-acetyltransferase [Pedobacter sp.]
MLDFNLSKIPVLETERLILRQMLRSDSPSFYELRTNAQVMQYIDRVQHKNLEESEAMIQKINEGFVNGANIIWAITFKIQPQQMIGNIGYWRTDLPNHRAEIGYMLHPDHWRQGIISEALRPVIDFGFNTLGLHSICANINPGNQASRQLLIKHGFVKEAYFKEDYYFNGKFLDSEIYGLLNPS